MKHLEKQDKVIGKAVQQELGRQRDTIELIASENFVSQAVMEATGSVLTNKYAEGYPARRYYGGCEHVDTVEEIANSRLKALFGAEMRMCSLTPALRPTWQYILPRLRLGTRYLA